VSLFGEATDALPAPRLPQPEDWSPMERLAQEHAAIGFYLSGHPLDDYAAALRRERVLTLAELQRKAAGVTATIAQIAGTVAAVDHRKSARGTRFAFVRLSDPTGLYEVRMFSDALEPARDFLEPGRSVVLTVEAQAEGDELRLLAKAAQPIDVAVANAASTGLRIFLDDAEAAPSLAARLGAVARDAGARRRGPVNLVLMHPELPGEVEIALPDAYPMSPQVTAALKSAQGVVHIEEF
jgi:DNA polymerase-3 subunit alpha